MSHGGRDPRDVLVAGAGAIGQMLGLRLMRGGHNVTLLLREAHAAAIRRDGLRIHGHSEMSGHPACATGTEGLGRFDAIVLTCKAHQTEAVARQVAPHLAADGIALTLQNGFGNATKMRPHVGPGRLAVALTSHGVMGEEPGRLLHAGEGPTQVGPATLGDEAAARRAYALLSDAALDPEWADDLRPFTWRKAIVNHAANPVAALHGCDNGGLLEAPRWGQCEALAREGYAIARCVGVRLPGTGGEDGLVATLRATLERTRPNRNSMVRDIEARRPTEIEQISGRLVRLARRLGIAAPVSDEVYRHLKAKEAQYLGEEASLRMVRDETRWEAEQF